MISRLPPDAGLPGLAALFDEATVMAMLTTSLPVGGDVRITGCRPRYVRYKPETTCLVQYDLGYEDPHGEHTTAAQIKAFADDRPRERAPRTVTKFATWTSRLRNGAPFPHAAYLAAVNGLLQVYPVDRDLRFLARAADAELMSEWVRESVPEFGGVSVAREPELIRYKPERKALLRYELHGHGGAARVYGKLHVDDRIGRLAAQAAALIAAGVTTPEVLFASPKHRFLAHAEASGAPLASLRGSPAYAAGMEPLALALRDVQAVSVPEAPVRMLGDLAAEVSHGARWLGRVVPHLAPRLHHLEDRIVGRLASVRERLATCHGDFYDDQALMSDVGLTIIDLDELCLSHPLLDAGNMLAHLRVAAERGEATEEARAAFLAAYARDEQGDEAGLAVFEALGILKLAPGPFRRLEPEWAEGIERIVGLAEGCLDAGPNLHSKPSNDPHPNPSPIAMGEGLSDAGIGAHLVDPAMAQLGVLCDRNAMSARFASALADSTLTVAGVAVVRHKPGRRAILRYETRGGDGRREWLYGKTFASERGPRVYAITARICAAQAFGADVTLPNPVAFLPDVKLLVQEAVPGETIEAALLAGDTALVERIATALHRFHASGLELGRDHDLARELSPLPGRVDEVGERCLALRSLGAECLARIAAAPWEKLTWRRRPVHRDFYHAQVLRDAETLAVLDLDDAAMSEPAVDVANFAAHVILLGIQHPAGRVATDLVAHTFVDAYRRHDAELDHELTRVLVGATLVRLAGIHVSRANGDEVARQLLERAARLLAVATGVGVAV